MISFIMKIYFSVWTDAINYERIKNGGESHWKIFTLLYMSLLMAINIISFTSAILYFTSYDLGLIVMSLIDKFLNNKGLSNIVWFFIIGFFPCLSINYFCVFHKKRYNYILEKYKFKNGRLLLIYFFLTFIVLIIFSLLNKIR